MRALLARLSPFGGCCCAAGAQGAVRKTRKDLRSELRALQDERRAADYAPIVERDDSEARILMEESQRTSAAVLIQSLVRSHLGRKRQVEMWMQDVEEADQFWLYYYWLKAEEERMRRLRELARKQFSHRYVADVVETSVAFVIQAYEAALTIQKTWRGHRCRMRLPKRPPPKPVRLVRKVLPGKFPPSMLRRVWAREVWEPEKGYLHNSDFGYLMYDMWEHVERPPEGLEHGLVTRKVHAVPATERGELILSKDRHAWVGLPVGWESPQQYEERVRGDSVRQLEEFRSSISPFRARPNPFQSPSGSPSPSREMARQTVVLTDAEVKVQMEVGEGELAARRLPVTKLAGNAVGRALQRMGYDVTQEFRIEARELMGKGKARPRARDLAKYLPPKVGDLMYDPQTGRLLVYRRDMDGLGWRGVSDGKLVRLKSALNHINPLPANSLPTHLSVDELGADGAGSSLLTNMQVRRLKSGYIEVYNPQLGDPRSHTLALHRESFLASTVQRPVPYLQPVEDEEEDDYHPDASFLTDPRLSDAEAQTHVTSRSQGFTRPHVSASQTAGQAAYSMQGSTPLRGGRKARPLAAFVRDEQRPKPPKRRAYEQVRAGLQRMQARINAPQAETLAHEAQNMSLLRGLEQEASASAWLQFQAAQRSRELHGPALPLDALGGYDHAYEELVLRDVWTRSVFRPPLEAVSRLPAAARRRTESYKLRFHWIPQPLVHNAVSQTFLDRPGYRSALFSSALYQASLSGRAPAHTTTSAYRRDVHTEIHAQSARLELKRERDQLLSIVTEDLESNRDLDAFFSSPADSVPREDDEAGSFYLSDQLSPMRPRYVYDDEARIRPAPREKVVREDDASSSAAPLSATHPERQHPEELEALRPHAIWARGRGDESSLSSLHSQDLTSLASQPSLSSTLPSLSLAPPSAHSSLRDLDSGRSATASAAGVDKVRLAFQSFLETVPEGRLPDAAELKNALRSTRGVVPGQADPPAAPPLVSQTLPADPADAENRRPKHRGAGRKFRFPQLARKLPRDFTVHPSDWH